MPARVRIPPEVQVELEAKARQLVERLRAGSTDLTAEGAAAFERMDPVTRVGMDSAMEQGWKPMQNVGDNPGNDRLAFPAWRSGVDPGEAEQKAWNFTSDNNPAAAPLNEQQVAAMGSSNRAVSGPALDENHRRSELRLGAADRTRRAAEDINTRSNNEALTSRVRMSENPRVPGMNPHPASSDNVNGETGPYSWHQNENIPGLAAGTSAAAAAAYALAPGQAQAAPPVGQQSVEPPLKTGASFGLIQKPKAGVPDPLKDFRESSTAQAIMQDADKVAALGPMPPYPGATGKLPQVQPRPARTLDEVASSPEPGKAFEQYLQSLGFETNPGFLSPTKNVINAVELLIHPAVRMMQDEWGRPLVETAIKAVFKNKGAKGRAGQELLARAAGMLIGGPAVLEGMDEKRKLKGVTELEDMFGDRENYFKVGDYEFKPSAAAMAGAQQVGELPLLLLGPGRWLRLGEAAAVATMSAAQKMVVRGAGAMLGGARAGGLSAIPLAPRESEIAPGMTIGEGVVGGALLGGAFEVLFGMVKRARVNDWNVENKLAEFARGDAADALKGQLTAQAGVAGKAARLSTTLDVLKRQKFQQDNAPKPLSFFKKKEAVPPAQPVRAVITKDGLRQMQVEVLAFPPKPQAKMDTEVFGPVYVHHDDSTGPVIKYIEKFDENGQPVVKMVPATIENVTRARAAANKKGFPVSPSKEFLAFTSDGGRKELALERAALNPTGWNDPAVQQARAKAQADRLDAVMAEASGEAPLVGETTKPGRKTDRIAAQKAGSPTKMAGTPSGEMWAHGHMPLDVPVPGTPPKVTVQKFENDVPWVDSHEPEAVEILVDGEGKMHVRPVVAGDTALPEDMAPSTQIEDVGKMFEDTHITGNQPTQMATVEDLHKLGFNKDATGGSGIGGGSYKGSKPEDVPVGFLGGGSSGGGGGGKKPPIAGGPLTPELPSGMPPPDPKAAWADRPHADLEEAIKYVTQTLNQTRSVRDALGNTFLSNHLRGPTWWSAWKTSYQASQILQRTSDEIFQFARQTFKGHVLDAADKSLYEFFKRPGRTPDEVKAAWTNVEKHIPENLRAKAKEFSYNMLAEKEALDAKLRAMGYTPDDLGWQREAGLLDAYLTRRYMLYAMPKGRYAKSLTNPKNKWRLDEGADYIYNELKDKYPDLTPSKVTETVLDLLNEADPLAAIKASAEGSRYSPLKSLIKREVIPQPIRNLLGEIESGQAAIAMSLSTQRSLVARYELLHDLHVKGPAIWSEEAVPAMGRTFRLPDNRAFGPLAGKYVNRDIFEGVAHLPTNAGSSHDFIRKVLGFTKGNQTALGGIGPLLNSTFGNLWSGVLAGGLDISRPVKGAKAFRTAVRALIDYSKDPSGFTGHGSLVIEARRHGADFFGFGHEEIGSTAARKFLEEIEKQFPKGKTDLMDVWGVLTKHTAGQLQKMGEKGGWLLDMNDRLFRMQSYIVLREKYLADLAKNGKNSILYKEGLLSDPDASKWVEIRNKFGDIEGYTTYVQRKADEVRLAQRGYYGDDDKLSTKLKGVSSQAWGKYYENPEVKRILEASAKMAARRINQSFWNPSFISKPLDKLRKSMMGVITPYATASFETMRINAMLMDRLRKEPDLWFRLAGAAALVGAGVGGNSMLRHLNDISDEQVDEAMKSLPEYTKGYRPAMSPMAWRDSEGRIQLWDYTRQFDPLRFLTGSGEDPMWARFAFNLLGNAAEGGAAEGPLQAASSAVGLTSPQPGSRPPGVATPRAEKILRFLFDSSLLPGAARNVYNAARQSDVPLDLPWELGSLGARSSLEPKLTPGQTVAKGLGISNIVPVDPNSNAREIERRGLIKKLRAEAASIVGSNLSDDEKERRLQVLMQKLDEVAGRP